MTWNVTMTQLLGSKGLTGYVDGKIAKPAVPSSSDVTPDSTPVYSTKPNYDEWVFRDQLARGHITLNCTDVTGLGVVTTGTAKEAWDSIQEEWGKSTDMRRSHAQEALDRPTSLPQTLSDQKYRVCPRVPFRGWYVSHVCRA
jgi:hypothetical protein